MLCTITYEVHFVKILITMKNSNRFIVNMKIMEGIRAKNPDIRMTYSETWPGPIGLALTCIKTGLASLLASNLAWTHISAWPRKLAWPQIWLFQKLLAGFLFFHIFFTHFIYFLMIYVKYILNITQDVLSVL